MSSPFKTCLRGFSKNCFEGGARVHLKRIEESGILILLTGV